MELEGVKERQVAQFLWPSALIGALSRTKPPRIGRDSRKSMTHFFSSFLLLILLLLLHDPCLSSTPVISELFENWCKHHGKGYSTEAEKFYRLKVFEDNYAFVNNHNAGDSSYSLSLNAFADLTHHEFKASRLGLSASGFDSKRMLPTSPESNLIVEVPASIDWRKEGAVTAVKDQGSCATGAIEGINKIVTGSLVSLSEQELIDCDRSYNSGCDGGLMDYAFKFVIDNQGIDTEEDYPFQARDQSCNKGKMNRHVVTIDGFTDVPSNNENELLKAVATQPVSVGICGNERAFQLYSKGIFNGPCSTSLDHAVLIVGYGSKDGADYWIVKNSWGPKWGMDGYIHMERGTGNLNGVCGINMLASYPKKTSPNPPPPPSPGPTKCDLLTHCGEGETCCCSKRFFGICVWWKCCGLDSAVCCEDKLHCCPHDHPFCDIKRNLCLKQSNSTEMEAIQKGHSGKSSSWSSFVEAWIL